MKRFTFLCAAMVCAVMAFAQLSIWNGSSDIWTKGAGTEASPFLIESAEQLAFISDMVNGGVTTYENAYFKLMKNIDLNNLEWVPIGDFKGKFDGNNNSIINSSSYLFGSLNNATIKRLNIQMKGMANSITNSRIEYCSSFCTDNGTFCDKAIESIFMFCKSQVNISKMGNNAEEIKRGCLINQADYCTIINCRTYGEIHIMSESNFATSREGCTYIGGLIGSSNQSNLLFSSNSSNISVEAKNGVDSWGSDKSLSLSTCYKGAIAGGIIGYSSTDTIKYSCSIGKIAGANPNYGNAYANYSKDSCGILGLIENIPNPANSRKKLAGFTQNSYTSSPQIYTIAKIRYDIHDKYGNLLNTSSRSSDTTAVINTYSSSDKTEASMKSASFPIILNTDSTVFIQDKYGVNDGYPIYKEQVYAVTNPVTNVQLTSAILNANYYALNADSIGFEFKQTNDKNHWYTRITIDSSSTETSFKLEGLETGTNYTYRFWVAQNGVIHFGEPQTFTTQECTTNTYPETATICNGEEFEFANRILTTSGVYYDTLTAVNGCDSVIELTLTVSPVNKIQKYDTIFVGDSYDFFGQILTETGTYTHYVPAGTYCNLVIMNLYVKQPSVVVTATSADEAMGTVEGSGTYEKYSSVTITAIPNEGYRFENWNDGDTNGKRILVLSSDTTLTAYFQPIKYVITAIANDEKLGIVYGGGEYAYNTSVSLMAVANDGAEFVTWTNGVVENPYIFKAVENMAIQAIFKTIPSGVDDIQVDENTTTKILQNGQLFIIRDGKTYTVMGQELK